MVARVSIFCFHHVDLELCVEHLNALEQTARKDAIMGGVYIGVSSIGAFLSFVSRSSSMYFSLAGLLFVVLSSLLEFLFLIGWVVQIFF